MEFTLLHLKHVLREVVGPEVEPELQDDDALMDAKLSDLGCDSLAMLDIAGAIEKLCDISVPDELVQTLKTPRMMLSFVNARVVTAQPLRMGA